MRQPIQTAEDAMLEAGRSLRQRIISEVACFRLEGHCSLAVRNLADFEFASERPVSLSSPLHV